MQPLKVVELFPQRGDGAKGSIPLQRCENPVKSAIGHLGIAEGDIGRALEELALMQERIDGDLSPVKNLLEQAGIHLREIRKKFYEARNPAQPETVYRATVRAYVSLPVTLTANQVEDLLFDSDE